MGQNKLIGGQPGKIGSTEYTLIKKLSDSIVVRNSDTNALELWGLHSDTPASFHLIVDDKKYEFLTSDRATISNKLHSVLAEMTATGAVAGYSTPFAFTKNKSGNTNAAKAVSGYTLVEKELDNTELIGEGKYNNFKKYPMKNEAKISLSLREVNRILREVESLVQMNNRLKMEGSVSGPYWKRSAKDVSAIKERTKNIVKCISEIMRGRLNEISEPTDVSAQPPVSTVPPSTGEATPSEKIYTVSIDFLNFENDLAGVTSKHETIIRKKVVGKDVTVRASKGYGQVEKDYSLIVKNVSIVLYKEKYNLVFKDSNSKEYYVNTAFKIHIKDTTLPVAPAQPANLEKQ